MRTFIAIIVPILALSVTARADVTRELAEVFRMAEASVQKCLDDNNLQDWDMAHFEAAMREKDLSSENHDDFLTDFGCTMTCLFEKAGMLEDDQISSDEIVKLSKENEYPMNDEIKEKINMCIDTAEKQDDKCKMGYVLATCLANHVY